MRPERGHRQFSIGKKTVPGRENSDSPRILGVLLIVTVVGILRCVKVIIAIAIATLNSFKNPESKSVGIHTVRPFRKGHMNIIISR